MGAALAAQPNEGNIPDPEPATGRNPGRELAQRRGAAYLTGHTR